ncbi:MAG: MarP family serine protease [Chloroflexota bacterium]
MTFNIVDGGAVILIALAVFFGWKSGLVVQAFALAGFVAGLALVIFIAPQLASLLSETDTLVRTVAVIGVVGGIVLLTQFITGAIGSAIRRRVGEGVLSRLDAGAGAAFGFVRGLFLVWLLGGLAGLLPLGTLTAEVRQSFVIRAIETRVPSPVVFAAQLGQIIEAAGLPDIFVGAPPPTDIPTDAPSTGEAEQIAGAARASTVRVEALACGNFLTGSGFAVGERHIVTNAHVVAGADRVWISFDGRLDRYFAEVVSFDPELDAALLYAPDARLVPLTLAATLPERGESAAAVGFTGGGRQRVIPAIVSRSLDAIGRDIYGENVVARDVIELREDVAPGDSGGPLLVPGGEVGGITFSESQNDTLIGYALSPIAVAESIAGALASTDAVETQRCLPR